MARKSFRSHTPDHDRIARWTLIRYLNAPDRLRRLGMTEQFVRIFLIVAGIVFATARAVGNAWVLMVEILR